jgi:membrane-bound lytic murein transglycosylase B
MCALLSHETSSGPDARVRVIECERVAVSDTSSLVRVKLALGGMDACAASAARLVVADGAQRHRLRALPGPVTAGAVTLNLGFAIRPGAEATTLEIAGRSLPLPAPRLRPLAGPALPEGPAGVSQEPSPDSDQALRGVNARLDSALATTARLEHERDLARRAAAAAEAAAHDATARAEALERSTRAPGARRRPRSRRMAGTAFASAWVVLICVVLVWSGRDGGADRGLTGVAAASTTTDRSIALLARRLRIPADYLELYQRAGARYGLDWTRLAAIGAIESQHGQTTEPGVATGANPRGASGPAQFLAATWDRFGLDGDADGVRDPHDPADAIFSMASYLRASGAPEDWLGALRTYNHSDVYADAVEQLAARYRLAATS